MTLREVLDKIPMGMGAYGIALISTQAPELAKDLVRVLDEPLESVQVHFASGVPCVSVAMADVEGQSETADPKHHERSGVKGDSRRSAWRPGLPG